MPSAQYLERCVDELQMLALHLNLAGNHFGQCETRTKINFTNRHISMELLRPALLRCMTNLDEIFGVTLTCYIAHGGDEVLAAGPNCGTTLIDDLKTRFAGSPVFEFVMVVVDKINFLATLGVPESVAASVFIHESALIAHLEQHTHTLEKMFGEFPSDRVSVLIVAERTQNLYGPLLSILCRNNALSLLEIMPETTEKKLKLAHWMCEVRGTDVAWQDGWLKTLTPAHLALDYPGAGTDQVADLLKLHAFNLSLMFLADRVSELNGATCAHFSNPQYSVQLELPRPTRSVVDVMPNPDVSPAELFEWVYDKTFFLTVSCSHKRLLLGGCIRLCQPIASLCGCPAKYS